MRCLDRFNSKMQISGNSLRAEQIRNSRLLLDEVFEDDASSENIIYIWYHGLKDYDNEEKISIRLYDEKFSNANGNTVQFQTLYDNPIIVGDILYDNKHNKYYICTESFDISNIHWQGKLTACNWILKWQNEIGEILEYPCYSINATQYNSGETVSNNALITVGSSQHMITLPCDENTVILNSPKRFFLDKNPINPTSYIVTQNDTVSYNYGEKGLVKLTVMQYANNSQSDRPDLGICDYFEPDSIKKDNDDKKNIKKSVIYYDTLVVKSCGDTQQFVGKFYDNNDNEITDIIPKWTIICDFKDELNIEENGNMIEIGTENEDILDETFKLVFSDVNSNYSSYVLVTIESLL